LSSQLWEEAAEHIIASPQQQIIDDTNNSTNPLLFTVNGVVSPHWFGAIDGTNDEVQIQSAVTSLSGSEKGTVDLIGESYTLADEVVVEKSNLTIRNGIISSTGSHVFVCRNASGF